MYGKFDGIPFNANKFPSRLWRGYYYDRATRTFYNKKTRKWGAERSFVQFIFGLLYQIYSQVIGEHKKSVETTVAEFGVTLSNTAYRLNVRPLLRLACSPVFGSATGFTNMFHLTPFAKEATSKKVGHAFVGPKSSRIYTAMSIVTCPVHLWTALPDCIQKSDCSFVDAHGRVYSGEIHRGQMIRVLGEGYSPDDEEEDMTLKEVTKLWAYQAGYRILITGYLHID